MPLASHRIRYIVLALVLTWMALVLLPRPAHGAWSADPVEVHATTALCPAVSAADDAHGGAVIVWQENTATGGAIFAWSQLIDRQGIYAIRLGQAGAVTGVTPTLVVGVPSLRVRFVRGEGVRAVARLPDWAPATIALHDVMGRRIASVTSPAPLVFPGRADLNTSRTVDVVLPGTRDLPGGVYFARATFGSSALGAKVIVLP